MKTSELTGAALDWAIEQLEIAEGHLTTDRDDHTKILIRKGHLFGSYPTGACAPGVATFERAPSCGRWSPSTDWSQGGPIIEREEICLEIHEGRHTRAAFYNMRTNFDGRAKGYGHAFGPTPLVAAMRCYVANKLGDEVDVPAKLK